MILVLIWAMGTTNRSPAGFISFLKKHRKAVAVILWTIFLVFAAFYVAYFHYFEEIHDIDDAVDGATAGVAKGINPYEEYIVYRFEDKYQPNPEFALGPYNYLPLDLTVYTAARTLLGGLGTPVWFVMVNLLFAGAALYLYRGMVRVKWVSYLPVAGVVMLFYSFDNGSLTLLFLVAALCAYRSGMGHRESLAVVLMGFAVMTKIYAIVPLAVLVLYELQKAWNARDRKTAAEILASVAAIGVLALLTMVPFGIDNVMQAAVFFHMSEDTRQFTSVGGTVLSEIGIGGTLFSAISMAVSAAALLFSFWFRSLDDRVMLVMTALLLVLIKSSLAPLTVFGIFLGVRLRELADARAAAALQAAVLQPSQTMVSTMSAGGK